MMYYRGLAFEVIDWIKARYQFWDPEGTAVDLPSHYLTQQILSLLKYKLAVEDKKGYAGAPHCTLSLLEKQIHNVVRCNKALEKYWSSSQDRVHDSQLGFGDRNGWNFEHREKFQPHTRLTENELIDNGTTELDQRFKDGDKLLQIRIIEGQPDHRGNPRKRAHSNSLS